MSESLDANSEFRKLLRLYRRHFGLSQQIVANIAGIKQSEYSGFETGGRPLYLNDADNLAKKVWGKSYAEFPNRKNMYPELEELPTETQAAIEERKQSEVKLRNSEGKLAKELDSLIADGKLKVPITAYELFNLMPKEIQENSKMNEITNLFNKSPRDKIVKVVGKEGRANLYQLKDAIKQEGDKN